MDEKPQAKMKKRKHKIMIRLLTIGSLLVVVVFISMLAYFLITDWLADQPKAEQTPSASIETSPSPTALTNVKTTLAKANEQEIDTQIEKVLAGESVPTEKEVIALMHHMSHQKVIAKEKWGVIEMKPERVSFVHDFLEKQAGESSQAWPNADKLLEIAVKWAAGNFSTVDEDHNFFWSIQEGTLGKATRIATAEEEEAFIQKNFR